MPTPINVTLEQILEAQTALTQAGRRVTPSTIRHHIADVYGKSASERTISAMLREAHAPSPPPPTPPPAFISERERERAPAVQEAPKEPPVPNYLEDRQNKVQTASDDYWKRAYDNLRREYDKALTDNTLVEFLAQHIVELAPKSYSPIGRAPVANQYNQRPPESFVLLLSDWHYGKFISPEQTLGFGEYNPNIALDRLAFLEQQVIEVITRETTVPVAELVVFLGGDMLDGTLTHGAEAGQLMVIVDQWQQAGHALAQFFRNLASVVPQVRVHTAVGNHGRLPHQKKMPTKNRYSNFDSFLSIFTQALTRDVTNLRWNIDKQPFAVFEVQGVPFHGSHGDHLRGGDKQYGIPIHSIARQVNSTNSLFMRHNRKPPTVFILGDKHKEVQIPTGAGRVVINGAFTDVDEYSTTSNYQPQEPSQVLIRVAHRGRWTHTSIPLIDAMPRMGAGYLEGL